MLKLILGRAGSGKTARLLDGVCEGGAKRPQVLLVPEQASHEMERRLCARGGDGASLYAEVLSFTRLAGRVAAQAGGLARPVLDGGGRMLLLYRALREASGGLKGYALPARRPAFLTGLLATVDELKSYRVPPEELARAGEEQGGLQGEKLRDLALICGAYDGLLAGAALDPMDRLTRLAEQLGECGWGAGVDLWVDGFTDFTAQQEEVLRRLLPRAHQTAVALTCSALDGEDELFAAGRRTARRLIRLAEEAGVPVSVEELGASRRFPAGSPLAYLEENLFADRPRSSPPPAGEAVTLFRGSGPRGEVEWAAASILALLRSGEYRLRDIAVTARDMGEYGHLIESVFRRYGVPVFLARPGDILSKPVMTLVSCALEIAARGYEYDSLFRLLKTDLTDLSGEDRDLLENYALKWDIRGSRWTGADWTMHPAGYGRKFTPEDRALLDRLNAARRRVTAPLERLRKNADLTGEGQVKALYRYLEEVELPRKLEERAAALTREGELALADEYGQLWDILCLAMEQCAALLGEADLGREEFARLFRLVLSQYDVGSIPVSLDRVTAGEMPRIVNREVRVLFLLGADDGSLPARSGETGLLTDEDRDLLADYGLRLAPRWEDRLAREMTIVYAACAQPSRRLYVAWSPAGADGGERRASFLVNRLRRLFPDLREGEEADLREAIRLSAPGPAAELAGRDEALREELRALPGLRPLMDRLDRSARWVRGALSPGAVSALYGSRIPMSASRLDRYNACHFSYFMQFGLKAEPRSPAGFRAPEYGTFVHAVLEQVLTAAREEGGPAALTPERRRELTRQAVERYVAGELGGLEGQTPRFRYLFRRLRRAVDQVVDQVLDELAASDFQPISFELGFGEKGDLPPVTVENGGVQVRISGFVDRVDGWVHDGRLYLRVVDYKTGRKSFDLTEIWNGMGLQMLLYLFTLQDEGEALYHLPVEPAGVLYLPAREAVVEGSARMSEEERRRLVDRQLRRHGLILDDPAVLEAMERPGEGGPRFLPVRVNRAGEITGESLVSAQRLGRLKLHTERILREVCRELAAGKITADPFWRGEQSNACRYCDYAAACHFEEGRGGDCRRWLPRVDARRFWEQVEQGGEE